MGKGIADFGTRVLWSWIPFERHVIPAKAGIHSLNLWKCAAVQMDSRLRGNDGTGEHPFLANDTSTQIFRWSKLFQFLNS